MTTYELKGISEKSKTTAKRGSKQVTEARTLLSLRVRALHENGSTSVCDATVKSIHLFVA